MDVAMWIGLGLKTSIFLIVLSLGLRSEAADAVFLWRRPRLLMRALTAMYVAMPLFALMLIAAFDLPPAINIALLALSVSPVPPLLPGKVLRAGGEFSYATGLLTASALLAIVVVPFAVALFGDLAQMPMRLPAIEIARIVALSVLMPLALGMLLKHYLSDIALQLASAASRIGGFLLIVAAPPVAYAAWHSIETLIGNGTIVAIVGVIALGLVTGHLLGGPDSHERTVLAFFTSSRHPGVALAIAAAIFPGEKLVLAAAFLYLVIAAIVVIPYMTRRRRISVGEAAKA